MEPDEVNELRRLVKAASDCVGPCGSARAIRSSSLPGARTFVTSSAEASLHSWPVDHRHHVLRLVIDATQAHLQRHGDGGWLFLNFSLRVTLALLGLGLGAGSGQGAFAHTVALRGLALAATWLDEALSDELCPCRRTLKWSDLDAVLSVLRATLCKPVALCGSPHDIRHLALLILEAFLNVMSPGDDNAVAAPEARVRHAWFCGPELSWSSHINGLLLDTPADVPLGAPGCRGDSRLALFSVSLEQWMPAAQNLEQGPGVMGIENYTAESEYASTLAGATVLRQWEESRFRKLAESLLQAQIGILACQKLVDPWLVDHLKQRGVIVLSRLSMRHIDYVQALSGAVPVASLAVLPERWDYVCGWVGAVELQTIQGRQHTLLRPPITAAAASQQQRQQRSISTLLIGAPDEHVLAELRRVVPQAVKCLQDAAHSGIVLEGGGLTEIYLSDALVARARRLLPGEVAGGGDAQAVAAVMAVAECLQDVAACLPAEKGKLIGRHEFLEAARRAIDQLRCDSDPLHSIGGVLDAEAPKRFAMLGALDLAGVLVRLGGTLDLVDEPLA